MPKLWRYRKRGPRSRVPRPVPPSGIQLDYFAELRDMVRFMASLVDARLVPALPSLLKVPHPSVDLDSIEGKTDSAARADASLPPGKRVNRIVLQAKAAFDKRYNAARIERMPRRIGKETDEHQKRQLFRQIKAGLGIQLETITPKGDSKRLGQFVAENVALIKTVPQQYFSQIEAVTLAGIRQGLRAEEFEGQLEDRANVAESRAKLIARDQVLKFNGELTEARHRELGINRYVWRGVEDEVERAEHKDREGHVYDYDDPPGEDPDDPATGGHPGIAINCRCWGEPYLADILASLDGEEGDE